MATPGQRIRQIAYETDLSLAEMSYQLGFNRGSLVNAIKYDKIHWVTAKLIEHRFGYSADWIMDGKEPMMIRNDEELPRITEEEFEMLGYVRALPYRVRHYLFGMLTMLFRESEKK